jgi:hypothetical protein
MIPHLDILPASQRALWRELAEIPPDFVLYGGTALALRLGHRQSEDFDFFSSQSFRAEAKDYIDISQILEEGVDLASALGAANAVYGRAFNPLLSLKALSYFADGDLSSLTGAVRSRLTEAVGKVDPRQIPEIQPLPGGINS